MMTAVDKDDGRSCMDINVTPLVDVMLVLLTILIITIPTQTNAIRIAGPSPRAAPQAAHGLIDLSIEFDGTLMWNGVAVARDAMRALLRSAAAGHPAPDVRITIDRFARFEVAAQTLADVQQSGLRQVAMVTAE